MKSEVDILGRLTRLKVEKDKLDTDLEKLEKQEIKNHSMTYQYMIIKAEIHSLEWVLDHKHLNL